MTGPRMNMLNQVDSLPADAILACLDNVLASEEFSNSQQLSLFLRHIVENTAHGTDTSLKESAVGVAVFNRKASYDPKLDPIVRVEARRLRLRLDDYYRRTGGVDPVRICLPKGGYVPVFQMASPVEIDNVQAPPRPAVRRPFAIRRFAFMVPILTAAVALAILLHPPNEAQRRA